MPTRYKSLKPKKSTMKAAMPKISGLLGKSYSGIPPIPSTRPTYKRNKPASPKGFKPGKY
jgi:hypothetical protein